MSNICRLCLRNEDYISKHDIFMSNLCDNLYWMFGVQVDPEDGFSKWICQKCINSITHVKKIRNFFQMNQYLLKEKKCPIDFDVAEVTYITMEVGTQTDLHEMENNDIQEKKFNPSDVKIPTANSNNSSQHIPIPTNLFNKLFSPQLIIPKLEDLYPLAYSTNKSYVCTEIVNSLSKSKTPKSNNSLELNQSKHRRNLKCGKNVSLGTKSKTVGMNTEVILGSCYIDWNIDTFRSKKDNILRNTSITQRNKLHTTHNSQLTKFYKRNKIDEIPEISKNENEKRNVATSTDPIFLNTNRIYVPNNIFECFASPYVLVDRLELDEELKKKAAHIVCKKIKRRKTVFTGKRKIVKKRLQTQKKLNLHRKIEHNDNVLKEKSDSNYPLLRTILKPNETLRTEQSKYQVNTCNASQEEEIDVVTIERRLRLSSEIPDLIFFNESNRNSPGYLEEQNDQHLKHDHTYNLQLQPQLHIKENLRHSVSSIKCEVGAGSSTNSEINDLNLPCSSRFDLSNDQSSSDSNTDFANTLFRINKTKYEIKIWEKIRIELFNDSSNGTNDLERKFQDVLERIYNNS